MDRIKRLIRKQEATTGKRHTDDRRAINRILRGGQNNISVHGISRNWVSVLYFMDASHAEIDRFQEQYVFDQIPDVVDTPLKYIRADKLRPFEEPMEEKIKLVEKHIVAKMPIPSVLISKDHIVLDGHHRLHAISNLGLEMVPCTVIEVESPMVSTGSSEVTKERIIELVSTGQKAPSKSTRFTVNGKPLLLLATLSVVN
jgi:hypothetical protein